MSGMAIQTASRAMAYRAAMNAMRGGVRKPRYRLPSWLTYANVAGAWKASRSARARLGTYRRQLNKKLFGSRKRAQGQARLEAQGKRRKIAAAPVPSVPSSRVPTRFAVAPRMTKFRKATVTKQKAPKSAIVHYKEFGQFSAEKCMYVNHEHWGHVDKFWKGIGYGLAKLLLPYAKIYNAKSMEDPCIGPRTNAVNNLASVQLDDKASNSILRLVYFTETTDGEINRLYDDITIEDISPSPDVYKSFDQIATDITNSLKNRYNFADKTWLVEAQFLVGGGNTQNTDVNLQPIYIQNLDDAEIHLYVNSLVKFQNVTASDLGSADKHSIDANPLVGRVYTAKGHYPQLDADLINLGAKTLDNYFGNVDDTTGGITLLGHENTTNAHDIGRVSHIPHARELYGNQTVKTGQIYMAAGAMKFHKTSFTLKKTFRALAGIAGTDGAGAPGRLFSSHSLFGFTLQHKHGEDTIQIGYNRDTDVGCYIKHKRIMHPLKTNYTQDNGAISVTTVPFDHT